MNNPLNASITAQNQNQNMMQFGLNTQMQAIQQQMQQFNIANQQQAVQQQQGIYHCIYNPYKLMYPTLLSPTLTSPICFLFY